MAAERTIQISRNAFRASLEQVQARTGMLNARTRWRAIPGALLAGVALAVVFWKALGAPWSPIGLGVVLWELATATHTVRLQGDKLLRSSPGKPQYSLDDLAEMKIRGSRLVLGFTHGPDGTAAALHLEIDASPEILAAEGT